MVSYNYDAWGNVVSKFFFKYGVANAKTNYSITLGTTVYTAQDIDNLNNYYYRGYYYDKETGFYYLTTRYYDPKTGRFISPDDPRYLDYTIAYGHNRYAYCCNNPVMYVDPSGTSVIGAILALIGIVGFALTLVDCEQGSQPSQLFGGASSVVNGAEAIYTGISLFAYGPVGWVLGSLSIMVGAVCVAFGSAEIQEGFTGSNWIKDAFPISDSAYNAVYLSANVLSAIAIAGGGIGRRAASNHILDGIVKNPNKVQHYSLWQIKTYGKYTSQYISGTLKRGHHIGQGYNLTNLNGATKGYIQWHPGSKYHFNGQAYWKVTSSLGGTWRGVYLF